MKLTTKGKYGVKAMVDLAINYGDKPVSIKNISERQNISVYYLEQLFSPLRKAKLIISVRGAQGGYILSKKPDDITISEIMDVLEGPVEIATCLNDSSCNNIDCCATRLLWFNIKKSIEEVTQNTTLGDIVNNYNQLNGDRSGN
ncbi:MAG: Rrf2 family transcriptional regulator [Clostridiaceae bacterium]